MQGKLVNIPSTIEDPNYRYKMPRLILKIEGKGNGIKTNLVNLNEVAKAIRINTEMILKYLGFELGSMTFYKEKGNDVTSIINGNFKEEIINQTLDKFIEKYVLCQKCHYPEMIMRVKNGVVFGQCWSCGAKSELDNKHRITQFILKNPPQNKSEFMKASQQKQANTAGTDEATEVIVKKKGPTLNQHEKDLEDIDEVQQEKKQKQGKEPEKIDTQEKQQSPQKKENSNSEVQNYVDKLTEVYESFKDQQVEEEEQQSELLVQALDSFNINSTLKDQISYIIFNSVFNINIAKQVSKNSYIIQATNQYYEIEGDECEAYYLANLQNLIFVRYHDKNLEKYIPTILKLSFDEDILSEEFLLTWNEGEKDEVLKKSFVYDEKNNLIFKEQAKDFIKWLKSASEQEEANQ